MGKRGVADTARLSRTAGAGKKGIRPGRRGMGVIRCRKSTEHYCLQYQKAAQM